MDTPRVVAAGTVILLVGVTLATGPLVGLSLTSEETDFNPGTGSVDASVTSVSQTATIERADYGAGVYYLRAPPVELQLSHVTGHPTIAYQLQIHELGLSQTTASFPDSSVTGTYELSPEPSSIEPDRVDQAEYDGTVRVYVRDDDGERGLIETTIRVEVDE